MTRGHLIEAGRERTVRRHDVDFVTGFQMIADPVGKDSAGNPLHGHHQVAIRRGGAKRIVAADFLAANVGAKCQMLACLEAKRLLQLVGNGEPDRVRLVGLGHDFRNPKRVKMLGHYQAACG